MEKKTYRAPLALALAALFAASLVPVSGADSPTTIYTFHTGEGQPKWTILQLEVTKPGIEPVVSFETDAFKCPSYWKTSFYKGTPNDATSINGFGFLHAVGRHGADAYATTPAGTMHHDRMTPDGREECLWFDLAVDFGELPLGTVYLVHMAVGVPFEGTATLRADPSAVKIVDMSSGSRGFFLNETDMAEGVGVVAHGPPFCGAPQELPDCQHVNPGGHVGAAVEIGREKAISFKHHPYLRVMPRGSVVVANASLELPDGSVTYLTKGDASVGDFEVNPGRISVAQMGYPAGKYMIRVEQGAHVGAPSHTGWNIFGADLRFPGEAE